ncbi:MAG TPA: hypothetical protein VGJ95_04955 [Pseudonocardiaceae bacterium]
MSSDYNALCLSHDPAIVMNSDERSWEAALDRARPYHPRCDLLIGRWSGALIELCCPGMPVEQDHKPHPGWHRDSIWADAGLLRVAAVAVIHAEDNEDIEAAVRKLPMCWTPERLRRISAELGIEVAT